MHQQAHRGAGGRCQSFHIRKPCLPAARSEDHRTVAVQVNAEEPPDIVPGRLIDTRYVLAINPFFNAGCT